MPPAIIRLVCPEARVKFKIIDFRSEADFASYCTNFCVLEVHLQPGSSDLGPEVNLGERLRFR
jgi:hypothetical protein